MVVGEDFHFGSHREGNVRLLEEHGSRRRLRGRPDPPRAARRRDRRADQQHGHPPCPRRRRGRAGGPHARPPARGARHRRRRRPARPAARVPDGQRRGAQRRRPARRRCLRRLVRAPRRRRPPVRHQPRPPPDVLRARRPLAARGPPPRLRRATSTASGRRSASSTSCAASASSTASTPSRRSSTTTSSTPASSCRGLSPADRRASSETSVPRAHRTRVRCGPGGAAAQVRRRRGGGRARRRRRCRRRTRSASRRGGGWRRRRGGATQVARSSTVHEALGAVELVDDLRSCGHPRRDAVTPAARRRSRCGMTARAQLGAADPQDLAGPGPRAACSTTCRYAGEQVRVERRIARARARCRPPRQRLGDELPLARHDDHPPQPVVAARPPHRRDHLLAAGDHARVGPAGTGRPRSRARRCRPDVERLVGPRRRAARSPATRRRCRRRSRPRRRTGGRRRSWRPTGGSPAGGAAARAAGGARRRRGRSPAASGARRRRRPVTVGDRLGELPRCRPSTCSASVRWAGRTSVDHEARRRRPSAPAPSQVGGDAAGPHRHLDEARDKTARATRHHGGDGERADTGVGVDVAGTRRTPASGRGTARS